MKYYRKIISIALVTPLVFLATFCCCIERAASAAPQIENCHSKASSQVNSDEQSKHSQKHECSCPKMLGESDGATSLQITVLPSDSHHFHPIVAVFIQKFALPTKRLCSFHSPPNLQVASIPLYLKYAVLRI